MFQLEQTSFQQVGTTMAALREPRRRGPRHPWLDQPPTVVVVEPVGTDWRTWWAESGETAYATLARMTNRRLAHEAQAGGEAEASDVAMN